MNVLDSELVTSQLRALGYGFTGDRGAADVVLYNTCSVREHAENKVYSRLGLMAQEKRGRPGVVVGVLGCMAERQGTEMLRKYPQVDFIVGPAELDKVPQLIDNAVRNGASARGSLVERSALQGNTSRRSATLAAAEDRLEMLDLSRSFSPTDHSGAAYVRITRGCNKFCSFCVVPYTRGAEVHRPPDHIVDECKRLVDAGVVEVTLLGQTVNHYHYRHGAAVGVDGREQAQVGAVVGAGGVRSRGDRMTTFADLLVRVHEEVPGLRRLRFVTNFPRDFGDDVLVAMRDHGRICRYLHLPVQSGSDRVLKLMNRGYTVGEYEELLGRARAVLPDVQVASDLITGFPTETESDHRATVGLIERSGFKNCFIFKYSPRPGTAAIDRLADDVPELEKRRRNAELLEAQGRVSEAVHRGFVGRTVEVFVESVSEKARPARGGDVELRWEGRGGGGGVATEVVTQLSGRTGGDLVVIFDGEPSLVGSIMRVRVERAAALALFGVLVDRVG